MLIIRSCVAQIVLQIEGGGSKHVSGMLDGRNLRYFLYRIKLELFNAVIGLPVTYSVTYPVTLLQAAIQKYVSVCCRRAYLQLVDCASLQGL